MPSPRGTRCRSTKCVEKVDAYDCGLVEITGGEPLLQREVYPLMDACSTPGKTVMVETGGHMSIERVPGPVIKIVDVKCPGSGEAHRNDWANLDRLAPHDEVKFVIKDRADYEYARDVVARHRLSGRVRRGAVLAGPRRLDSRELAAWILEDKLDVRLQLQAHKFIWGADVRGV